MGTLKIGLLAYGSLRWDLRELLGVLNPTGLITVTTPFPVEFARQSGTRDGCPTLIPVESGGAFVAAAILPFREGVNLEEAQTQVWRRETGRTDGAYNRSRGTGPNKVYVEPIDEPTGGFDCVLSVRIARNIDELDSETLAALAIRSAAAPAGGRREDGITYLQRAKQYGIVTPLLRPYEQAILRQLSVATLDEAWATARSMRSV